jgi:uncharacterized damage-inducible protein DinB
VKPSRTSAAQGFLEQSRAYLQDDYVPRIARCLDQLSEEDVWWRPNEASNSICNLILHVMGNARQWILHGVGGAPDVRHRQEEFDQREAIPKDQLLSRLSITIAEVADVLCRVPPEELLERRSIQGYDTTVLGAIYHVVEHFAMHTGQIILLTKARTGRDAGLYVMRDGHPKPAWTGEP